MSEDISKKVRPWYQKKRFAIPLILVVLGVISAQNTPEGEQASVTTSASQAQSANSDSGGNGEAIEADPDAGDRNPEPSGVESTKNDSPASSETSDQRNARESAESYLRFSAFSRTGLIEQLEYEGYSFEDASYAVDAVEVDWFEQAVKSADSYLEYSSFSRDGLLDQLLYEGFTQAEAAFGVGEAYGDEENSSGMSADQANAIGSAESYLRYSAFSRTGLIAQLEYEGFTSSDSVYAVDSLNVDWFEQAAKSAESYLEYSSFSRQGLYDQLIYEGYSPAEAEYGVDKSY
jgi:colicin import membrane protein